MACAQAMAHPVAQPDETGTRITERTRKGMGMKHHHNIDELREALADKRGRIALSRRGFLQGAGVMAAGAAARGHDRWMQPANRRLFERFRSARR